MRILTIQGTPYEFPDVSESPDWSREVVDWAEAVTEALGGLAGSFDINNLAFTLSNSATAFTDITNFSFEPTATPALQIAYACRRTTSTINLVETGVLQARYDSTAAVSSKWSYTRDQSGSANVDFYITDVGQVQVKIGSAITGTGYTGNMRLSGKAFEI